MIAVGVEGTGAYGVGLARFLHGEAVTVIEVDRPNRQERRRNGKSDQLDAVEAARAALSGRAKGIAKTADGNVEAIRVLVVAKRSARAARTKALTQIRHLGFCAPDALRDQLRDVPVPPWPGGWPRYDPARMAMSSRTAPRSHCRPSAGGSWPSMTSSTASRSS